MSNTTHKLRKILIVLLSVALILLPSLIALADETQGPQGTPTPEPTVESTPQTIPQEPEYTPVPSDEVTPVPSDEVTPVPSDEVTPVPSDESSPEPSETASPTPEPMVDGVDGQLVNGPEADRMEADSILTFKSVEGLSHYTYSYWYWFKNYTGTKSGGETLSVPNGYFWSIDVTITAYAKSGYVQDGWKNPSTTSNNPVTKTMDKNRSVKANFIPLTTPTPEPSYTPVPKYELTFTGASGLNYYDCNGTTYTAGQSVLFEEGESVTVNAIPIDHYEFRNWVTYPSGGAATGNSVTFTMPASAQNVEASFYQYEFLLTFEAATGLSHYDYNIGGGSTTGTASGGQSIWVPAGEGTVINAIPAAHYANDGWTKTLGTSVTDSTLDFDMVDYDASVQAKFAVTEYPMFFDFNTGADYYTYTVDSGAENVVSGQQTIYLPVNSTVVVTAVALEAYLFDYWGGDTNADSTSANTATYTMNANKEADAKFKENGYRLYLLGGPFVQSYTVSYNSTTMTVSDWTLGLLLPKDVSVTVTANGESGTVFDYWDDDHFNSPPPTNRNGNIWTFTLNDNYTLKAFFEYPIPYLTTFSVNYNSFAGSTGTGKVNVYYPGNTYAGQLSPGGTLNLTYQSGANKIKVEAVPDASTNFIKWTNHGGVTTPVMEIDLPTGQGSASSLDIVDLGWFEVDIDVVPEFEKKATLSVTKTDSYGSKITGLSTTFKLEKVGGGFSDEQTSTTGEFYWDFLEDGTYVLTEISAPSGYYYTSQTTNITLSNAEDKTISVENFEYVTIHAVKHDITNPQGAGIAGAEFAIFNTENGLPTTQIGATQFTNGSGAATFHGSTYMLKAGVTYWIKEISPPPGYQNDAATATGYAVTIAEHGGNNEGNEVRFENTPILQSITVVKYFEQVAVSAIGGGFLDGTEFELWQDTTLVDTQTLLNGTCEFTDLLPGSYVIKEIDGDTTKYINTDNDKSVTLDLVEQEGMTTNVNFYNSYTPSGFAFIKHDSLNDEIVLEGAIYRLTGYKWNGSSFELTTYEMTTNSSGYASVTGLTPGEYTFYEVTPPAGYDIDSTVYDVVINPGRTTEGEDIMHVTNDKLGKLTIAKFQSGTNDQVRIFGAVFSLYKDSVDPSNLISTQTTDPNGNIVWTNLVAGDYVLVEDSAPNGYTILTKNTDVTIDIGEEEVLRIYNDGPTPTPTPEETPDEPDATPTPTPTPEPTATPTPIQGDELEIEDIDPAFGPETGEGDGLFITIGLLLLLAAALFVLRKTVFTQQRA